MTNATLRTKAGKTKMFDNSFDFIRWSLIAIVFILTICANSILKNLSLELETIIMVLIFSLSLIHGTKRYGLKNILFFILITWVVSNLFEALSVYTGFPYGNYRYTLPGPRILDVPLIIMPSYIGMGYLAWILSLVLNRQYSQRLSGKQIFLVPFIATFIMVMWDVVMDPMETNVYKSWIWEESGSYLGVPLSNYFGWFLVVYIFMQIYAILISRFDTGEKENCFNRLFWFEAVMIFFIQGVSYLLKAIIGNADEIYASMGLTSIFTMIFVAILSAVNIYNSNASNFDNISRHQGSLRSFPGI